MEKNINLIAAFASILSLALTALSIFVPAASINFVAFGSMVVLVYLYYRLTKSTAVKMSVVGKEELIKIARNHINSASKKIILFSNDLSWVHDYAESLRKKIGEGCQVWVLHKKSTSATVNNNAEVLRNMGAQLIELKDDHRIRATLIDPDDMDTAILFVANKRRISGSATLVEAGRSGTDKDFHYECAVYQSGADKMLVRALARLAEHGFPDRV